MQPDMPAQAAGGAAWVLLRGRAAATAAGGAVPAAAGHGLCASCRGPVRPGRARCFHCQLHTETAPGMLADVVAPAAYAVKGGPLARDLWLYKSRRPGARHAQANLLALLLVFLHDHAPGSWARVGLAAPTHACVVPSGRGRPGPHPLQVLARPYLRLPWAELVTQVTGGAFDRMLDLGRFRAAAPLPGAAVLLLDDTWVSGGSAQSAAVALKRAGAQAVALVVLGRHIAPPAVPPPAPRLAS